MTQSDDDSGRYSSCESKCLEDKLTVQQTVTAVQTTDNEVNRGKEIVHSLENATLETKGTPNLINTVEMGSTDSAGNTHSGGASCGFVRTLIPNSCRGRAESFALCLRRRLNSLSGDGVNASENEHDASINVGARLSSNKANETTWLHAPTNSATSLTSPCSLNLETLVLDSQPRHSPESDVYYDLENCEKPKLYNNGDENEDDITDSPAERANDSDAANILVNEKITRYNNCKDHKINQEVSTPTEYLQDSETGCLFASPLAGTPSDTDKSETFFDPESSETEKTCENSDDVTTNVSRATEGEKVFTKIASNEEATTCKIPKYPLRRKGNRIEMSDKRENEDFNGSSESSSSSSCNNDADKVNTRKTEKHRTSGSSEESINGNKSSLETTTSPSNESLWSTFDESTLSLQDENTNSSQEQALPCRETMKLPKSHSDSDIEKHSSRMNETDEVDHANIISTSTNSENVDTLNVAENDSAHCSIMNVPGALMLECSTGRRIEELEITLKKQVDLRMEKTNDSELMKSAKRLGRSVAGDEIEATEFSMQSVENGGMKEEISGTRTNDETDDKDETKEVEEAEEEKNGEEEEKEENVEDNDDDENKGPGRLRRSSSLKTGKTPPGTPSRKKFVRFADVLGLDLADVRTFIDVVPKVPNSAYSDLKYDETFQKDASPVNCWNTEPVNFTPQQYAAEAVRNIPKLEKTLIPLFQQPGGRTCFFDNVRERLVCLENVVVKDPINTCLCGIVRVRNLDFHKSVHIRYTLDSWKNFNDLQATYASNSCDGFSDKFTFVLCCQPIKLGQKLELAVRFQCKGAQYWDNNDGVNYCFQCLPVTSTNTTNSALMSPVSRHDWSPNFY